MLRDPHLTDGIGVRIARNIHCTSTKDALRDRVLISVISAEKRKTTKPAKHKERTRIVEKKSQQNHLRLLLSMKPINICEVKNVIADQEEIINCKRLK